MASNQTHNLQLCQWEADDEVLRADFNADNAKLDAAVGALAAKFGPDNMPWVMGSYTGSGAAAGDSQEIVLGFKPKLLIVVGAGGLAVAASYAALSFGTSVVSLTSSTNSSLSSIELALTNNGFQVMRYSVSGTSINRSNANYIYFALR